MDNSSAVEQCPMSPLLSRRQLEQCDAQSLPPSAFIADRQRSVSTQRQRGTGVLDYRSQSVSCSDLYRYCGCGEAMYSNWLAPHKVTNQSKRDVTLAPTGGSMRLSMSLLARFLSGFSSSTMRSKAEIGIVVGHHSSLITTHTLHVNT